MARQVVADRERAGPATIEKVARKTRPELAAGRGTLEKVVFGRLGKLLKLESAPRSSVDFAIAVAQGLSADSAETLVDEGILERQELDALVPRRTLSHRREQGQRLKRDESDALARVAKVAILAEHVFGESGRARRWLRSPKRAFKGLTPREMLATSEGAQLVEEALIRINEGYFA